MNKISDLFGRHEVKSFHTFAKHKFFMYFCSPFYRKTLHMKNLFLMAACLSFLFCSCRTPKDISYFQGVHNLTEEQRKAMDQAYNPRICIDDVLIINVTSPDRETAAPYNPPPYAYYKPGESEIGISAETQNLYTYLVDEMGYINFPILGRIKLSGFTINEATRMMENLIKEAVPNVLVYIQIANFKVGIFGEVARSNTYTIKSQRVSILDLIALAGNLNINADRKNVLLIRDNDGRKELVKLDLTDPEIFASPYYYLQQNDMVYVEPNEAQKRNALFSNENGYRLSVFTAVVSVISLVASSIITIRGQK
jgi:polysaccharide export outer membrane protein